MKKTSNVKSAIIRFSLAFSLLGFISSSSHAQGIGINSNGQSPYAGAILDIVSNNKGVLLPRTDTLSIANPIEGMIIFDTVGSVFRYYSGQRWLMMLQEGYYSF